MDVMTALENFERLTGKPVTALDEEVRDYGVTVQEIVNGKIQPSRFLITELADILSKDFRLAINPLDQASEWDFLYRMMEESQAFRQYCQAAHENPLIQMNELDDETLERLFSLLHLGQSSMVIDVGCGNGALAEYISDRTQAHFLGIDACSYAIQLALERTKNKRDQLAFRVGDVNRIKEALVGYPAVDTIMALEVLYASNNLQETIGDLRLDARSGANADHRQPAY